MSDTRLEVCQLMFPQHRKCVALPYLRSRRAMADEMANPQHPPEGLWRYVRILIPLNAIVDSCVGYLMRLAYEVCPQLPASNTLY